MARPVSALEVTTEQREQLRRVVNQPTAEQRAVRRAAIILHRSAGQSQQQTADLVGVRRTVVVEWEKRFRKHGLAGLADAAGRGRKPSLPLALKSRIITQATRPPPGRTRWSCRSMARAVKVSEATVQRLWAANDIKPHISKTFKLSNDPEFERKFWDVIGLYLNPPHKALVFCCDEKSQIQALERTQRALPLAKGYARTRSHDYFRHGTITLFAALSYLEGKVFSQMAPTHTHQQWLAFLKGLERANPKGLTLHLILDNYATHKHPEVKAWLQAINLQHQRRHGCERMVLHFTPTASSWMNLVERFFRDLTEEAVREGSFGSVQALVAAIDTYLAQRNLEPKRYVWKAQGADILAKIQRARAALAGQEADAPSNV